MESDLANILRSKAGTLTVPALFALTGGAGAGKTTMVKRLVAELGCAVYHVDWRFLGNSEERLQLLRQKQSVSIESLLDAVNQFNWWDWDAVSKDLCLLTKGQTIQITSPYERALGIKLSKNQVVQPKGIIVVEGALLGPPPILQLFSQIFCLSIPDEDRLMAMLAKDRSRRTTTEIVARFLITQYSEDLYYSNLYKWYGDRTVWIDREGNLLPRKQKRVEREFIPVEVI